MISYPAKIGDVTTRIFTAGTEGRPVMFVHGFGAKADRWKLNMDPIAAAGFRAYAFDLPGHGFASKSDNAPSTVPEYSDFLGKVMDHLEVSNAVLVGTSLGGAVVASFAAQHSDRVEALVFVGSMGLVPIGEEIRSRIRAGSANQTLEAMQAKFRNIIADQSKVTVEMIEEEFHTNNSPGAAAALIKVGRYIGEKLDDDVVGQKIASLNKPTLLVWGDEDKVVPLAFGRAAREMLPNSRLCILEGTSHTPYYEKFSEFNAAILDFLSGRTDAPKMAGVQFL
jgi:2-hydroxy-6-oxonona-2,4-dienedioate hydrolase